jgi:hypothetical protein
MWTARQTRIKTEMDQIAAGFEAFRTKYGSYPPTNLTCQGGNANAALTAFVARVFPRYVTSGSNTLAQQIAIDLANAGVDTTHFNPQRAIVFWLGGFNPDVTQPFNCWDSASPANYIPRSGALFAFDATRLIDVNTRQPGIFAGTKTSSPAPTLPGAAVYNAPYGNTAFVYYDWQSYGSPVTSPTYSPNPTTVPGCQLYNGAGITVPYIQDQNSNLAIDTSDAFYRKDSFQLICAGQDGDFGTSSSAAQGRLFPSGIGYDPRGADNDNVVNFNEKSSLDAAKP